ncbi:MAG: hypothetical protein ACYTGQ_11340 [Planctomycetota bacterium]|jgi:hypothetical protein
MLTPSQVVDEYYLEVRCKLLEIAAIMDRYDRAKERDPGGAIDDDPRLAKCSDALAVLTSPQTEANRAEQVALVFSDPAYAPGAFE